MGQFIAQLAEALGTFPSLRGGADAGADGRPTGEGPGRRSTVHDAGSGRSIAPARG